LRATFPARRRSVSWGSDNLIVRFVYRFCVCTEPKPHQISLYRDISCYGHALGFEGTFCCHLPLNPFNHLPLFPFSADGSPKPSGAKNTLERDVGWNHKPNAMNFLGVELGFVHYLLLGIIIVLLYIYSIQPSSSFPPTPLRLPLGALISRLRLSILLFLYVWSSLIVFGIQYRRISVSTSTSPNILLFYFLS
jgi:hypothetical protein